MASFNQNYMLATLAAWANDYDFAARMCEPVYVKDALDGSIPSELRGAIAGMNLRMKQIKQEVERQQLANQHAKVLPVEVLTSISFRGVVSQESECRFLLRAYPTQFEDDRTITHRVPAVSINDECTYWDEDATKTRSFVYRNQEQELPTEVLVSEIGQIEARVIFEADPSDQIPLAVLSNFRSLLQQFDDVSPASSY